ncbi:MAG: alpha/beta fold hydrolase [Archaeoglobaceae archaeon]
MKLLLAVLCTFLLIHTVMAEDFRPIIFVHGIAGSGAQFESQALRFTSNGYPESYIKVVEYDTIAWALLVETELLITGLEGFGFSITEIIDPKDLNEILKKPRDKVVRDVFERIDEVINKTLAESGKDKVDLVGHSMGTFLLMRYVNSSPERASKVAHLILLDGIFGVSAPQGIPTLAIFGNPKSLSIGFPVEKKEIYGAENVYFNNTTHVQLCTSPETFFEMFKFINGYEPATKEILPQEGNYVKIAGKFLTFATNGKVSGWLAIYPIDEKGKRLTISPVKLLRLEDGDFGPINLKKGQRYEFVLYKDSSPIVYHYYRTEFLRNDSWVRFLVSSTPLDVELLILPERLSPRAKDTSGLLILRYKEMIGEYDEEIGGVDKVYINNVNVCTEKICPISKAVNGLWVFDRFSDGKSDLEKEVARFSILPFMSAVDLVVSAKGTVNVSIKSRSGGEESFVVPAWSANKHSIIIQFSDYK